MTINVKFSRPWGHDQDGDGNVERRYPSGWVGDLADPIAAQAISDDAAVATGKVTSEQQKLIDTVAETKAKADQEAEERRQLAAKIRADAATYATASDEELLAMAQSEGVVDGGSDPDQGSNSESSPEA